MAFEREIDELLESADTAWWWRDAARVCVRNGDYEAIPSRDGHGLYLLRCWLSMPNMVSRDEDGRMHFDSGDSVLLHGFNQPDDDGAPHDHPWDFTTEILQGSYDEETLTYHRHDESWSTTRRTLSLGDRSEHKATDIHCVAQLHGPTWTLVRTGPKIRNWGFYVKPGVWVPWQKYLTEKLAVKNG